MRRDGFGSVSPMNADGPAQFVTRPLEVAGVGKLAVNAEGLSSDAWLRVELVDDRERPIPRYFGRNAAKISQSGVEARIQWPEGKLIRGIEGRCRIRVSFEGPQRDQLRLYALYLTAE
jgi:hypothetical protein